MPELVSAQDRVTAPSLRGVPAGAFEPKTGERPGRLDAYPDSAASVDPDWCTEYAAWNPSGSTALRVVGVELFDDPGLNLNQWSVHVYPPDQMLDVAGRCLEGWYSRVAEWVSVLTGQDLNHHHQLYAANALAPGFRVWGKGGWRRGAITAGVPTVHPVGADDLREVLVRVGDAERPVLEWQLMVSGSSALDRGYLRTAVADFATAMEVCLTRMVRTSTSVANPPGDRTTLRGWSKWLVSNDSGRYFEPPGFETAVELRNDVLHRGVEPTYEQVREAYDCALGVVRSYGMSKAPWQVSA